MRGSAGVFRLCPIRPCLSLPTVSGSSARTVRVQIFVKQKLSSSTAAETVGKLTAGHSRNTPVVPQVGVCPDQVGLQTYSRAKAELPCQTDMLASVRIKPWKNQLILSVIVL